MYYNPLMMAQAQQKESARLKVGGPHRGVVPPQLERDGRATRRVDPLDAADLCEEVLGLYPGAREHVLLQRVVVQAGFAPQLVHGVAQRLVRHIALAPRLLLALRGVRRAELVPLERWMPIQTCSDTHHCFANAASGPGISASAGWIRPANARRRSSNWKMRRTKRRVGMWCGKTEEVHDGRDGKAERGLGLEAGERLLEVHERNGEQSERREMRRKTAAARLGGPEEQVLESLAEALRGGEDVFGSPRPGKRFFWWLWRRVLLLEFTEWKFGHLGQLICTIPQHIEIHACALPSFQSIDSLPTLSTRHSIEVQDLNSILNNSSGISGSSTTLKGGCEENRTRDQEGNTEVASIEIMPAN
ncbi:hypothetical protein FB451DRAFT_1165940 [Mycena latifolia]|nr:hypothetical protein FB451DRAFT_1165940 [Mycena latifolia]